LDNATLIEQFDEIEKKIEGLMGVLKTLEGANSKLKDQNKQLEEELQKKAKADDGYEKERDLIRSKIDGLLAKLENISEASQ
jgi:predicted nuclease with TOPRIM domain